MATLNHVYVSGHVVRDAECRTVGGGTRLCTFSIGVSRSWQQHGEWKKETSFVDVKAWGELAEQVGGQLHKGAEVTVQGRIQQERWETDGGSRSRLVVVADRIHVIKPPQTAQMAMPRNDDDDLPF